jgi:hypothetical protein
LGEEGLVEEDEGEDGVIKKCPKFDKCAFERSGTCNMLPVFYATLDYKLVGGIRDILRKKCREVPKKINRWCRVFPAKRCEFEVTEETW